METLSLARPSRSSFLPPVINGQLFRRFCFNITIPCPLSPPPIRPQHRARTKTSISIIDDAGIILLTDVMAQRVARDRLFGQRRNKYSVRCLNFFSLSFSLSIIKDLV